MTGLKRGTVELLKHEQQWEKDAHDTIALLKSILQKDMIDGQHVGSTSIKGICAKTIIDIVVGVKDYQDIMKHNDKLAESGLYFRRAEHTNQLLYVCGDIENDFITHHIHAVIYDSVQWNNYLNFRDYLSCHQREAESIEFVHGIGKRKCPLQRYYEKLKEITDKLKEYATKIEKCGEYRNSYSKTDEDATFMRMKTDYMENTALLPAYNWQLAVSNEYILFGLTSQSAADNTCFIPLMEKYRNIFGEYPKYPVADAGYGNLETYKYCENNNIEMYMKYPLWKRETHDKKFHNDIYRSVNFNKDEEGNIICPNNRKFIKLNETTITGNIDKRTVERYQCENCEGCPFKEKCHKGKGNRIININEALTVYHKKVIENLGSPLGIELRKQRSIQAEEAFGIIKQDYNYRRITRVSLKKVNTELYMVIIGFNLAKYHNRKYRLDYLPC